MSNQKSLTVVGKILKQGRGLIAVGLLAIALSALVFICACPLSAAVAGKVTPVYLRCEYRVNPLGIDVLFPRLSWIVESKERDQKQSAYRILVASSKENLDKNKGDLWDSGKVASDETSQIAYAGIPLVSKKQCFWKVQAWDKQGRPSAWSAAALWSMGLLNGSDWKAAWIGHDMAAMKKQKKYAKMKMPSNMTPGGKVYLPSPYLRKEFRAEKQVSRATVYATALGLFEIHLNGKRVGKDYFTPGWTDYNKRIYYLTYDVTSLIRPGGENAIGAILADGWYAGNVGGTGQHFYGFELRLKAQLHIEYKDGSEQIVATDNTWKGSDGALREADIQAGETYDARREMRGWSEPGFNDSAWKKVDITESVNALIQAYPGIPVRKTKDMKPIKMTEPKPGVFVFDIGQNFAGISRLKVKGKAGDKVVLRFAEMLNPDGTVYTTNLRSARVTDTYILKGGGEEIWEPSFTYHGYRYIEITGYPGRPKMDAVTGVAMHSDLALTSSFQCSNPMVNKLYSNIMWGQRSNYFEVPTDCPQRDERLGWMGDAQIFVHAAAYNMDIAPFFTKWMVDVEDGQRDNGGYTDVSPAVSTGVTAAWGDAGVICPWTIYKMYGDKRIIEKHYNSMDKWVKFLEARAKNYLSPELGSYGDWLNVNAGTDRGLISTAYAAHSIRLTSEMAKAIGKNEDADAEWKTYQNMAKAFTRFYVSSDGTVAGDTQTGYVMALRFGLLPDNMRTRAARRLVENVKAHDWSLTTGFIGGGMLLPTLTDVGRTDVAYRLLQNRKYPSWGYSIDQGATTIWERWNSYTKEHGFGDPGMNSFNHYAYGSVGEWMFSVLGGIDTDGVGFRKILIHPRPGGGMTYAKAGYDSINGRIATEWKYKGSDYLLDVTIPANTTATVYIPAADESSVTEGGRPAGKSPGVKFLRMENGEAVYETGSGKYTFASKNGRTVVEAEEKIK